MDDAQKLILFVVIVLAVLVAVFLAMRGNTSQVPEIPDCDKCGEAEDIVCPEGEEAVCGECV